MKWTLIRECPFLHENCGNVQPTYLVSQNPVQYTSDREPVLYWGRLTGGRIDLTTVSTYSKKLLNDIF